MGERVIGAETDEGQGRVKRLLVGRAMATGQMEETLLSKFLALPIFASDPLSSVAYATEAALVVLVGASAGAAHLVFPVSIGIAVLLAIVVLSYRQTVLVYQSSGGAYIVAKENLGKLPSLVAAASLLTDYILTVAVSVAAGVLALTSAVTSLQGHELTLSLACVALITVANLRGVREAGILFALPTYAFVTSIFVLMGVGFGRCAAGACPQAVVPHPLLPGAGAVTLFVVLRAFASGSTALTGVEAIANGVNAFKKPHGKNAATTLAILGAIAIAMFLGVSWLAVQMHAAPTATGTPSVLSEIARGVFPAGTWSGFMYWVVQVLTLAVLVLAANTSFQGFPRLAALLARDRFFARQFTNLGDRLVFSNGIIVLTLVASASALGLQRERRLADPPLRDRRVHRVHALAGRDGALLAADPRPRLVAPDRREHGRRHRDRHRDADRDLDEVHRGGVARDRRDPAARAVVPRDQPALPPVRSPAAGRCVGRAGGGRDAHRGAALGRRDRRRRRERALVRAPHRARAAAGDPHPRARTRIPAFALAGTTSRRRIRSSRCSRSTRGGSTRCSRRCGGSRAARRTS